MYDLKSSHFCPENTAASHHSPKLGHTREKSAFPPPPPPHPPPNIPYSWHIISIGPESCHQELWLVDIIPYYRRAPSKNIPSKRKWLRGQGLFCVGPFIIILYSVSPVVYEWHVENKKVTKINCTTCWV